MRKGSFVCAISASNRLAARTCRLDPAEIFPPAPDYGSGVARRRLRLTGHPGRVIGEMEDHAHGMRCLIEHDGRVITSVSAEFLRLPRSTCSGARGPLNELLGLPFCGRNGVEGRGGNDRVILGGHRYIPQKPNSLK